MTAVATRPVEVVTPVRRHVLSHGLLTIIVANGLIAVATLVMVRQFTDLSSAWLALPVVTALLDLLFLTPTRIEIRDEREIVVRTLAHKRAFDRGAVILRPARVGRSYVLLPLGRPQRPLAHVRAQGRTLGDLLDARVAIVRAT